VICGNHGYEGAAWFPYRIFRDNHSESETDDPIVAWCNDPPCQLLLASFHLTIYSLTHTPLEAKHETRPS
jgi:hypothetical protein